MSSNYAYGFSHPRRGERGTKAYPLRAYRLSKEEFDLLSPEAKEAFVQRIRVEIRKLTKTNTPKLTRKKNTLKNEHATLWNRRITSVEYEEYYQQLQARGVEMTDALKSIEDDYKVSGRYGARPLDSVYTTIAKLSERGFQSFEIQHIITEIAVDAILKNREARVQRRQQ